MNKNALWNVLNHMKCTKSVALLAIALTLASTVVGCKKKPQGVTPLPGSAATRTGPNENTGGPKLPDTTPPVPIETAPPKTEIVPTIPTPGVPPANPDRFANMNEDRERFKTETVYFDFDKSNVKSSETHKLDAVAAAMKTMPVNCLRVEGHCDERGTEEYNRSLGERRALAIREYLVMKGMDAAIIDTISFGKNKPVEMGHNEAAWSKNRRGDFILLTPKGQ
jgi:peptidoglycan-associated lipoprotein